METGWNGKNALRMLLYIALYCIGFLGVCVLGAVHPIVFVLYQVVAGVLLTGILVKAFDQIQAPGVAVAFAAVVVLAFVATGDASAWHCVPLVVIALIAEVLGLALGNKTWKGVLAKTVVMTFATFGFYGQIWFNRDYTYEAAIEEMPAGYADTLMACSPDWAFPAVMLAGIMISVLVAYLTARLFKLQTRSA